MKNDRTLVVGGELTSGGFRGNKNSLENPTLKGKRPGLLQSGEPFPIFQETRMMNKERYLSVRHG